MSQGADVEENVFGEIRRLCFSDLDEATLLSQIIALLGRAVAVDS